MGSEDLFHKRKKRSKESLKRRTARRDPFDVALIVCEGEKTEPRYLQDMRDDLGLNADNVVITGDCASSPMSVVEEAIRTFEQDSEFDSVFCVFDRDTHAHYDKAINKIQATTLRKRQGRRVVGRARFEAITSVPCFEFWLLLHFRYTTQPFCSTQTKSPCERVIAELRHGRLPDYQKSATGCYTQTKGNLDTAMKNAKRTLAEAEQAGTDNPSTRVHDLVQYLFDLSHKRRNEK